jgi:hypothetical protein
VGRPVWREDVSVFCICYWHSPVQSFLGPSPFGLETIFYCLRFETSFRRLLWLAGSRWRYSNPPPLNFIPSITHWHGPLREHRSSLSNCCLLRNCYLAADVALLSVSRSLPSSESLHGTVERSNDYVTMHVAKWCRGTLGDTHDTEDCMKKSFARLGIKTARWRRRPLDVQQGLKTSSHNREQHCCACVVITCTQLHM